MLRRTFSSVASEIKSVQSDQENDVIKFDILPQPSPNRAKYEAKFIKDHERRPLGEKTNKSTSAKNSTTEETGKDTSNNQNSYENEVKESKSKEEKRKISNTHSNHNNNYEHNSANSSSSSDSSFQDLFHLNHNSITSSTSHANNKVEELSMALSETLKENEQLHDTVSLLKAEMERLNEELVEYREYAELYLLGKELIENQAEEIENLKKKLVKIE